MTNNNIFYWLSAGADQGNDTMINEHLAERGWPTVPWWDGVKSEDVSYTGCVDGYKYQDTVIAMTCHLQEWVIAKGSEAQIRLSERLLKDREQHKAEEEAISGEDY